MALACTTGPETHPSDVGMIVLALLRDEEPEEVQPHDRLVAALEAAAGEYEDYRDLGSAAVERVGGGLRAELETAADGGQELLLTPTRVEEDVRVCLTVIASGFEREARFEFGDGDVDLFFQRLRLPKSE